MVAVTKAERAKAVTSPSAPGKRKLRLRLASDAFRQARSGQRPITRSRASPMGTLTWLKKGAPTLMFTPRTASEIMGKIVPRKPEKAAPTRIRLLNRKLDSRETSESRSPADFSQGSRRASSVNDKIRITAIKAKKSGPMELRAKEGTEGRKPLRGRNGPKMTRPKVRTMRTRFHTFSMSRFSWIITECRKAVHVSQGKRLAFSTGSQAQ